MNEKTRERLAKIQELVSKKEAIERELETLLSPEKEVVLPTGFSINAEVLMVVKNAGQNGIDKSRILRELQKKYPSYGINRLKVASALAYLKNTKNEVELVGRGVYRATKPSVLDTIPLG